MYLRIEWLFPRLMGTYGDRGNVLALEYRCRKRGIQPMVREVEIGGTIDFEADLFFIGGGQDKNQAAVGQRLLKDKDEFVAAKARKAVMLGICGGYQLFGHSYVTGGGERIEGLGLLDVATRGVSDRAAGPVKSAPWAMPWQDPLVGFENHAGRTFLGEGAGPLAKVLRGVGNNGFDGTEGAQDQNVFGSYLHGPMLVLNPKFCDLLIELALRRRYSSGVKLQPLDDGFVGKAREACLRR